MAGEEIRRVNPSIGVLGLRGCVPVDEKDRTWRHQQLNEAVRAINDFADDCRAEGAWLQTRARTERTRTRVLTLTASIVATVAGAGSLSQLASPEVVGAIALGSAVLGTVATFFATDAAKVEQFVAKAAAYRQLEADIRQWVRVDALDPSRKIEAVDMLIDFRERRADLDAGLPLRRTPAFAGPGYDGEDLTWVIQDPPP